MDKRIVMDLDISNNKSFFIEKNQILFPTNKLFWLDYLISGLLFLFILFFFFHQDLYITTFHSLNYLLGGPFDFYDNCKRILSAGKVAAANYPPSIFLSFSLCLYPFKLLCLIKSPRFLSLYFVYWTKLLCILFYLSSAVFYKITQLYHQNKQWGIYGHIRRINLVNNAISII